jgi:hypothetical protein
MLEYSVIDWLPASCIRLLVINFTKKQDTKDSEICRISKKAFFLSMPPSLEDTFPVTLAWGWSACSQSLSSTGRSVHFFREREWLVAVSPHCTCYPILLPSPCSNPIHFSHPLHNPSFPFTIIGLQPAGESQPCGRNTESCITGCRSDYPWYVLNDIVCRRLAVMIGLLTDLREGLLLFWNSLWLYDVQLL